MALSSSSSVAVARRNLLFARALCAGILVGLGAPADAQAVPESAPAASAPAVADAASAAVDEAVAPAPSSASAAPQRRSKRVKTATDLEPAYGLALKQYVNRLSALVLQNLPRDQLLEARAETSVRRSLEMRRKLIMFPQPLVVALRYDAAGNYLNFDYVERTGNYRTDTDAGRALQNSVWLLSPPPSPPGSTEPFTVFVRLNENGLLLTPPHD